MNLRETLQFCKKRRWALFFLNLVAGLFAAPFLYWNNILMRVILRAAQEEPELLWLNAAAALGNLPLIMLAALGAGGCLAVLRKMLRGSDRFLPGELFRGMGRCAGTSLLAGAIFGLSLGVQRVGLVNLYAMPPGGLLRVTASAFLWLQLILALPLCLLTLTREDDLQRRPLRALAQAGQIFTRNPVRILGLAAAAALPPQLFFLWQPPALTLLGFFFVALCGLVPAMLLWQNAPSQPPEPRRRSLLPFILPIFAALDALILALPFFEQGISIPATLSGAAAFIARLYSDSATLLRGLLAASSVWPLLLAALLGSACCAMAAFACACYKFRLRGLVFAAAVLLQMLPILASYSALEQLLRNLELPFTGTLLGLIWALTYLLSALLLYRRFAQLLPGLQKNREQYPGVRLFFYYALPRAPVQTFGLVALATFGCWADALAPFWYMQRLGAFSLFEYLWERRTAPGEFALCAAVILALLGVFLFVSRLTARRAARSPTPIAD